MPKISVLMSSYNRAAYIEEAIQSILDQTFKDFEFIIIDDGSTDGTLNIIQGFAKKDPRIVFIRNKRNKGLIHNLRHGISIAQGEYIARMDDDDISMPSRFEKQVAYLDKHPDIAVLGSFIKTFGESILASWVTETDPDLISVLMNFFNPLCHPSVMMRKSFLIEHNLNYSEKALHAEEYDLWKEILLKGGKLANLDSVLLKYRCHKKSITQKKDTHLIQQQTSQAVKHTLLRRFFKTDQEIENLLQQIISHPFQNNSPKSLEYMIDLLHQQNPQVITDSIYQKFYTKYCQVGPKVSVIVPVYNAESYLGQCLDSILLQTLNNIEVICVDDGSTDNSLSTLQTYAMFDERVKVITQENSGPGAARNRGLKEARGEFVIFLDSDDFFEADMLQKMVNQAEQDESDIVTCGYHLFDNRIKGKIKTVEIENQYAKASPCKPEDLGSDLFVFCTPAAWNKLIRRTLIEQNNLLFDEHITYAEDQLFSCRALAAAKKISILKTAFVCYRMFVPTSLTSDLPNKKFKDALKALTILHQNLKEKYGNKYLFATAARIRKHLNISLSQVPSEEKREALISIRQIFPSDLVDTVFGSWFPIKISIIIPVYNTASFLPKCLDSCLNQTLKEIEIICVDDGSTDNSLEILTQYAQKDNRITVLHQENQRQAIARNKAMEIATGQYIQFVDSDDWIDPDTCECLYLYSELYKLQMCQFTAIHFGPQIRGEKRDNHLNSLKAYPSVFSKKDLPKLVLANLGVAAAFTIYEHSFLIRHNIHWINKKIAYEDTPFFIQSVLQATRVGALDVPFYRRNLHSQSTVAQVNNNLPDFIQIATYTLNQMKQWDTKETILSYCHRFAMTIYLVFKPLENTEKAQMSQHIYDFFFFAQKKYHLILPKEIFTWCKLYLKSQKRWQRVKFYFYRLKACCFRNQYTLNLFTYQKEPLCIKVLGIPLLYAKKQNQRTATDSEDNEKKLNINHTTYIKVFGLNLLKIEETQNV